MAFNFLTETLQHQKDRDLYRQRTPLTQGVGRILMVDGEQYINFSSNDYLGLSSHPDIGKAFIKGIDQYGNSAASSSLVTGYTKAHQALEEQAANWLGFEKTMLFSTGFAANTGVLHALAKQTKVSYFLDKLAHASLIDGAFTSTAKAKRFRHNDTRHLNTLLSQSECTNKLTVVEGVYSMDGDCAPLADIIKTSRANDAWIYVDDAHGIGVLGKEGQGTLAAQNTRVDNDVIHMATFGKALGCNGAIVSGSCDFIDYCTNFARDYIYSTAMSPAQALANSASIALCQKDDWRRDKIQQLSQLLRQKLDKTIVTTKSETAIVGVIIGRETDTLFCAEQLKKQGFWLTAIRPPTVERGLSRLRVTVSASHNVNDIISLAECINEVVGQCLQKN